MHIILNIYAGTNIWIAFHKHLYSYIYIYKCYIKRFAIVKQKAKACSKNMCHKICIKKKRERERKNMHAL